MKELAYTLKVMLLKKALRDFLNGKSIGMHGTEKKMCKAFVESFGEKDSFELELGDRYLIYGDTSTPDIIVHIKDRCVPIVVKYGNASKEEYDEKERACRNYVKEYGDVYDAFCVFVSTKPNLNYKPDAWGECEGNPKYHYLWIQCAKKKRPIIIK